MVNTLIALVPSQVKSAARRFEWVGWILKHTTEPVIPTKMQTRDKESIMTLSCLLFTNI